MSVCFFTPSLQFLNPLFTKIFHSNKHPDKAYKHCVRSNRFMNTHTATACIKLKKLYFLFNLFFLSSFNFFLETLGALALE